MGVFQYLTMTVPRYSSMLMTRIALTFVVVSVTMIAVIFGDTPTTWKNQVIRRASKATAAVFVIWLWSFAVTVFLASLAPLLLPVAFALLIVNKCIQIGQTIATLFRAWQRTRHASDEYPTLLHAVMSSSCHSLNFVVRVLVKLRPESTMYRNCWGELPILLACQRNASLATLHTLIDANPKGLLYSDNYSETKNPAHTYLTPRYGMPDYQSSVKKRYQEQMRRFATSVVWDKNPRIPDVVIDQIYCYSDL